MQFDSFSWDRSNEIDDADQFCLVYTHNRDSGLLDQSNAEAIRQAMKPFLDRESAMSSKNTTNIGPSDGSMATPSEFIGVAA